MNIFRTIHRAQSYSGYKEAAQFAKTIPEETWSKMSKILFCDSASKLPNDTRICGLSKDVFHEEQVFYHGEKLVRKPKSYVLNDNYIICDEMGG